MTYAIRTARHGSTITLNGAVVAITTGGFAAARTLLGQADFRAEVEATLGLNVQR